jgi:UDP-4-amino-4,6-dideoxy-N-acetyl-beta-L-altrosamine transaminase
MVIPYGRQHIDDEDVASVAEALRSDFLTQGTRVVRFEREVADYAGAAHAAAFNSATSALHAACMALGLKEGDTAWTSPNSFVASANCALYCGASVDFVDIDPKTYNMCPDKLEEKLKSAAVLPKIVIPVDFSGQSCDMRRIRALSEQYGFRVIEDASHAIGGSYGDRKIGSCEFSDICIFSFHPVKVITTGEGGMATTNDPVLARAMEAFRSHGITRDKDVMEKKDEGAWYYEQRSLGMNYRITDIQCALGSSQMRKLDRFVAQRHAAARRYDAALKDVAVTTPYQAEGRYSAYHLYVVQTERRDAVFAALKEKGVGVNVHYIPIHLQPYYRTRFGFKDGDFPESERYYRRAISLPLFPGLTEEKQDYVISSLKDAL